LAVNDTTIEIISTSALRQDSGDLHFDYKGGYEEFGNRVYNLITRDVYKIKPTREIDSPMIIGAYLSDSTTLVVIEKADSLIQHDKGLPIQNYEIENAGSVSIDTIYLVKNKIVFKLSKYPGRGITVSYLAQYTDSANWLTNTGDIETVCFYEHIVADSIQGVATTANELVASTMKIYPNPFHNQINIALNTVAKYFVQLDDITGRKLDEIEFTGNQYKLSAEGLAKGLYFLRVFDNERNQVGTIKIMCQ